MILAHKLCKENFKFKLSVKDEGKGAEYRSRDVKRRVLAISGCKNHELSTTSKMINYLYCNMDTQLSGLNQVRNIYRPKLGQAYCNILAK